MSRDQQPDRLRGLPDPADEPTTGPPAGAVSASGLGAAPGPGNRETTSRQATTGDRGGQRAGRGYIDNTMRYGMTPSGRTGKTTSSLRLLDRTTPC